MSQQRMDAKIAGLPANPFDFTPRFYPPGQHPATHRMREHRRLLLQIRVRLMGAELDTGDVDANLDYINARLAAFEEQESECKQRTLYVLEQRGVSEETP